jgi:hypothetical protein
MEETLIINQNEEENPGKPVRRPGASPEGPGKAGIGQRRGCHDRIKLTPKYLLRSFAVATRSVRRATREAGSTSVGDA